MRGWTLSLCRLAPRLEDEKSLKNVCTISYNVQLTLDRMQKILDSMFIQSQRLLVVFIAILFGRLRDNVNRFLEGRSGGHSVDSAIEIDCYFGTKNSKGGCEYER